MNSERQRQDPGPSSGEQMTALLRNARAGDRETLDRLLPQVYEELRRIAGGMSEREPRR